MKRHERDQSRASSMRICQTCQKNHMSMEQRPGKETYGKIPMHMKRDPQKGPIVYLINTRTPNMSKKIWLCENKPTKETNTYEKKPTSMKKDIYNKPNAHFANTTQILQKCRKKPISVKRDLYNL